MKSKWKWVAGVLVVGVVGWWFLRPESAENQFSDITIETVQVRRGDLRVIVEATGKVVANANVEVKSKASGELLNLPFEEGDYVEQGTLLVELDPDDEARNVQRAESNLLSARARLDQARSQLGLIESDTERTIAQAEADLLQAQARFDDAKARFDRRQELADQGVLSTEEMDAARTALQEATSQLTRAQAAFDDVQSIHLSVALRRQDIVLREEEVRDSEIALEEARERFEDTRIVAPATGVITDLQVEEGQIIASGISNVGGGTTLMTISDLSRMFIEVKVDETDIGRVKVGQECEITADAFPEITIPGHVEWIAPQGLAENNIVSFNVRVEIDLDEITGEVRQALLTEDEEVSPEAGEALGLRPNMTARVTIITSDLEDVLLVENRALQRNERNRRYVEVVLPEGASPEMRRSAQAAAGERRLAAAASSGRPGGAARSGGRRPGMNGRPGGNGGQPPMSREEILAQLNLKEPVTRQQILDLGPSDGIHTHVAGGLSSGEEIYIPIPEWRLDFIRQQLSGEEDDSRRRRRGIF